MDTILLTGGTGCLGKYIIQKYIDTHRIINVSRDEHKHWKLDNAFGKGRIHHVIGDAGDVLLMERVLMQHKPSTVFILHALKHVDRCQTNVHACIQTNLVSIKNVLDSIEHCVEMSPELRNSLKHVIFLSTDKAASPVNVYGMCKAICETYMEEKARNCPSIKFVTVRYGNVSNSTSSVIPLWLSTKKIVLTDPNMTRFWMTIDDAFKTVQYALEHGESGEIIIPKLKAYYIRDLADICSNVLNQNVQVIGTRPGERRYEVLINDTQSYRCKDMGSYYHIVPDVVLRDKPFTYDSSKELIGIDELKGLLKDAGLLTEYLV